MDTTVMTKLASMYPSLIAKRARLAQAPRTFASNATPKKETSSASTYSLNLQRARLTYLKHSEICFAGTCLATSTQSNTYTSPLKLYATTQTHISGHTRGPGMCRNYCPILRRYAHCPTCNCLHHATPLCPCHHKIGGLASSLATIDSEACHALSKLARKNARPTASATHAKATYPKCPTVRRADIAQSRRADTSAFTYTSPRQDTGILKLGRVLDMLHLNVTRFIKSGEPCVQCGRPRSAMQGTTHNGWCWFCVRNRMEGLGIDSYGRPFVTPTE